MKTNFEPERRTQILLRKDRRCGGRVNTDKGRKMRLTEGNKGNEGGRRKTEFFYHELRAGVANTNEHEFFQQ
jgi:hypothetical protein